ncbi:MAG: hypothetical protein KAT26_07810, partial [Marinosulfonomonas sp.]|nr:hypothetical protein [Marinosulfonomonas sp.]
MLPANKPSGMGAVFRPIAYCTVAFLAACSPLYESAVVMEESAVMESAPAPAPAADTASVIVEMVVPRRKVAQRTPRKGVITAGDIDDTLNFAAFRRYLAKAARATGLPKFDLSRPVMVRLTGPNGQPAPGVRVTLRRPGASAPFYSG